MRTSGPPPGTVAGGDSDLSYLRADSAGQPPVRAFREGPYLRVLFPVVRWDVRDDERLQGADRVVLYVAHKMRRHWRERLRLRKFELYGRGRFCFAHDSTVEDRLNTRILTRKVTKDLLSPVNMVSKASEASIRGLSAARRGREYDASCGTERGNTDFVKKFNSATCCTHILSSTTFPPPTLPPPRRQWRSLARDRVRQLTWKFTRYSFAGSPYPRNRAF